MKKMFLLILCLFSLFGCSKDENPNFNHLTEYRVNQSYTQTFYFAGDYGYISPNGGHTINYFNSTCNRLTFGFQDDEENYSIISPSKEQIQNLENLNKDIKGKEHKYYLIANIHFQYVGFDSITMPQLKSSWKVVIGKMEEYVYDGKIYEHLVIVNTY